MRIQVFSWRCGNGTRSGRFPAASLDAPPPEILSYLSISAIPAAPGAIEMPEPVRFLDRSGAKPEPIALWPSVVIPKEAIDAEVERLASLKRPENGRRRALITHPKADTGNGLAPGIQVALDVLLPGERTVPYRQNSTQVNFV